MTVSEQKRALRPQYIARSRAIAPAAREAADAAIRAHVLSLPAFQRAKTVFLYCGRDWEINTAPLLRAALTAGKRLCVPLCPTREQMLAKQIFSPAELRPGKKGILEPPDTAPTVPPEEIDFILLPCVSACRDGRRLGQGGGYYDRFLPQCTAFAAVLCREAAVADFLPTELHDRPADALITELGPYGAAASPP